MTTKNPIEQRAFDAFKKDYPDMAKILDAPTSPKTLMCKTFSDVFKKGYFAAAKAEKTEISDEKIRLLLDAYGCNGCRKKERKNAHNK